LALVGTGAAMTVPMMRLPGRRAVPEWIGATPDSEIPTRVKLRIWEREGGRCYLTGRKILVGDAFDYEHVKRIRDGGENRESNIKLALRDKHREKTGQENSDGAKPDRARVKHLGIGERKAGGFRGWKNMRGEPVWRDEK
jgi:5-methylcytosine-specific restriction protein A